MIVCSRKFDPKSNMVVKYTNMHGTPIQHMPIRTLMPNVSKLSDVARFIYENLKGIYVGGFNKSSNCLIIKGSIGSQYKIDLKQKGQANTDNMYKCYELDKNERASCEWLFSVIESNQSDEEYLNKEALKIKELASPEGQIIVKKVIDGMGLNVKTKEFIFTKD